MLSLTVEIDEITKAINIIHKEARSFIEGKGMRGRCLKSLIGVL